jgi:predicted mannosyl-3-phosphoglycerate phosphatase (HAD superfamily)
LAKKVHKLEENTRADFQLIGISSYENDYRVCWDLNNCLKTELQRIENFEVVDSKTKTSQEFPVFQFEDENKYIDYKFIGNRCENGFLVKEWKNMDYFLKISGEITAKELTDILNKIKKSKLIQTSIILEPKQPKIIQLLNSVH